MENSVKVALLLWLLTGLALFSAGLYRAGERSGYQSFIVQHQGETVGFPASESELRLMLRDESLRVVEGNHNVFTVDKTLEIVGRGRLFRNLTVIADKPLDGPLLNVKATEVKISNGYFAMPE